MESQLYTQWVQTQVPDASQQHSVAPSHEVASRGPEDWSKDRMQNVVSLPVQSPSLASQTLEGLNEFTLGDLSGELLTDIAHECCTYVVHARVYKNWVAEWLTGVYTCFPFRLIYWFNIADDIFQFVRLFPIQCYPLWCSVADDSNIYSSIHLLQPERCHHCALNISTVTNPIHNTTSATTVNLHTSDGDRVSFPPCPNVCSADSLI